MIFCKFWESFSSLSFCFRFWREEDVLKKEVFWDSDLENYMVFRIFFVFFEVNFVC